MAPVRNPGILSRDASADMLLTVNDPVEIHEPAPTHGSYHWAFERYVLDTYHCDW